MAASTTDVHAGGGLGSVGWVDWRSARGNSWATQQATRAASARSCCVAPSNDDDGTSTASKSVVVF